MNIEELLEKYFEGDTSAKEEQQLRAFFAGKAVPEELTPYKALFGYFDEEIAKAKPAGKKVSIRRKLFLFSLSGVAACVLLLLGYTCWKAADPCTCSGNYVMINGKCYTDINKIRSCAMEALQEVNDLPEDLLDNLYTDNDDAVINEFNRLGDLFDDRNLQE